MKNLVSIMITATALIAGSALADDTMTHATPSKQQAFKACIEKQKTADVNMSKAQMTRLCKDEMKRESKGEAPLPPADVPPAT